MRCDKMENWVLKVGGRPGAGVEEGLKRRSLRKLGCLGNKWQVAQGYKHIKWRESFYSCRRGQIIRSNSEPSAERPGLAWQYLADSPCVKCGSFGNAPCDSITFLTQLRDQPQQSRNNVVLERAATIPLAPAQSQLHSCCSTCPTRICPTIQPSIAW